MKTAQVTLACLPAKKSWIVSIQGTTKLAHLEENLRSADMPLSEQEINLLESEVSKTTIIGDRYARRSKSVTPIGH